jgi:menaquinone-dependent protoporphyrinogen oxidase
MMNVLVAYATKYGSTAGVAAKIGNILASHGHRVDVRPVTDVYDPASYDAIVLGSAVYIGRIRRDARRFLKENLETLSATPTWLFTSGPTDVEEEFDPRMSGWYAPASVRGALTAIKPRDKRVFAGAIDPVRTSGLDKWMLDRVGAKQVDARDWNEISDWADDIAAGLAEIAMPEETVAAQR